MLRTIGARTLAAAVTILALAGTPGRADAHCDTLDGPVVAAARQALASGDLAPALRWVHADAEAEIREAFDAARRVRQAGGEAQALADRYFFETLVRVHRAGEGAPYTGLQPAGAVEPAIALADRALETGSVDALVSELRDAVGSGLRARFDRAAEARRGADANLAAGRAFVAAYVEFIHYAERIHQDASGAAADEHGGGEPHR